MKDSAELERRRNNAGIQNEGNGTWYVMPRYVSWESEHKQKGKRGFTAKKGAQEWERMFQLRNSSDLDMNFNVFTDLYIRYVKTV